MSSDWISSTLGIVGIVAELCSFKDMPSHATIASMELLKTCLDENINWTEFVYGKIGNELSIEPIGFI